ncbi:MAG TPA: DUF4058 family protein [Gemmataceae bacterium]|nr:DUF4058 family protein [Gemmataceae bacterium]
MPLQDHFAKADEPPAVWESFHGAWANAIMAQLNRTLPKRFRAFAQIHLGRHVEADVAEIDRGSAVREEPVNGPGGGVAVKPWAPPAAALKLPAVFPDDIIVPVVDKLYGSWDPVAVVELVSPGNKDRPETRRAFAAKSAAYLQGGIGLIIVDGVTRRHFNLHNEVMEVLRHPVTSHMPAEATLYTVAYRPNRIEETNQIEVWPTLLAVGQALPIMPLALKGAMTVPVDLEAAYTEALERSGT